MVAQPGEYDILTFSYLQGRDRACLRLSANRILVPLAEGAGGVEPVFIT